MQPSLRSPRLLSVLALALAVVAPHEAAAADSVGTAGTVVELTLNSEQSAAYGQSHGMVKLQEGDAANATKRDYKWGGSVCSGVLPTEEQKRLLFEAMRAGYVLQVVPSWRPGVNGARCLVGIKLRVRPAN